MLITCVAILESVGIAKALATKNGYELDSNQEVSSKGLVVLDFGGKEIESQLLPLTNVSLNNRNYHVKAYLGISPSNTPRYWLVFSASVPPLGFSTYIVTSVKGPVGAATTEIYTSE